TEGPSGVKALDAGIVTRQIPLRGLSRARRLGPRTLVARPRARPAGRAGLVPAPRVARSPRVVRSARTALAGTNHGLRPPWPRRFRLGGSRRLLPLRRIPRRSRRACARAVSRGD